VSSAADGGESVTFSGRFGIYRCRVTAVSGVRRPDDGPQAAV